MLTLIAFGGAFIVAIIVCVCVARNELRKTELESAIKKAEVLNKMADEALAEAMAWEDAEDEDDEYEDE